jgi:H+/Cl- antiporter ClcA
VFGLGAVSYTTRTPGGLRAPRLVLGAVVGMAAFFPGVVRAQVTGIALTIEMTAGFTMPLPMLAARIAAMLVPALLGYEPIHDSRRERRPQRQRRGAAFPGNACKRIPTVVASSIANDMAPPALERRWPSSPGK